jgi:hypothetical protein
MSIVNKMTFKSGVPKFFLKSVRAGSVSPVGLKSICGRGLLEGRGQWPLSCLRSLIPTTPSSGNLGRVSFPLQVHRVEDLDHAAALSLSPSQV